MEHQVAVTQPHILCGLGGVGKTQMVLEYAYRYRDAYQAVLWVGAETAETLMEDYLVLAHLFQLPEKESSNHAVVRAAVKCWFLSHTDWLLIFDNVEDLDLFHSVLPDTGQGHILITTRSQSIGTLGSHLDVQQMEQTEGTLFLLRRAKVLRADAPLESAPASVRTQADTLVDLLDGLPLALDQAGAYIEETACSLSEYLERYAAHRKLLLNSRGNVSTYHPASVAATVTLALQQVEQASPLAADVLRVCAFLHAEAIPEELFTQARGAPSSRLQSLTTDPLLWDVAFRELRRFSLLYREPGANTLSFHRLVQAIIQDEMNQEERKQRIERIIQVMLEIFPNYENAELSHKGGIQASCQRYLSHALVCAESIKTFGVISEEAGVLLYRVSYYLQMWGDTPRAVPLLCQALEISKNIFGGKHGKTAWHLYKLATPYITIGQYARAEECLQEALHIQEKIDGPDHPIVAEILRDMAGLYCLIGRYKKAAYFAQQALAIQEFAFGLDHQQIARVLTILGVSYRYQGKYTQSETVLQRALCIYKQTLGKDHYFIASCLSNLADLHYIQAEYPKALILYQQDLQICKKRLGPHHLGIAHCMKKLGNTHFALKHYHQAQILYQQALLLFEKSQEGENLHVAFILIDLGELHLTWGHLSLAGRYLQRVYTSLGKTLGIKQANYQELTRCLLFTADHCRGRGELTLAHAYYRRATALAEHTFGAEHTLTAHSRNKLEALLSSLLD